MSNATNSPSALALDLARIAVPYTGDHNALLKQRADEFDAQIRPILEALWRMVEILDTLGDDQGGADFVRHYAFSIEKARSVLGRAEGSAQ